MRNHIKHKHPSVLLEIESGSTPETAKRQTTLMEYHRSRQTISKTKYESLNMDLALMCAVDLRPMSIVDGRGFKKFINNLNPDYAIPSKTTVTNYVNYLYTEVKAEVMKDIRDCPMGITTDMWTSTSNQGYITVTGHYIKDWCLKPVAIATRMMTERHTGAHLACKLDAIFEEFCIDSVVAIVTDNAANMVSCCAEAKLARIACFAHTLQLGITEGLQLGTISHAVATGKRVVTHFSQSVVATDALLEHQRRMGTTKPVRLVKDVQTRWNSVFLMIKRMIQLRVNIIAVIHDEAITKPGDRIKLDIKDSIWKIFEDMIEILEPLAEATDILGMENTPTLSSVHVLIPTLMRNLSPNGRDAPYARDLKAKIRRSLVSRFHTEQDGTPVHSSLTSTSIMATILDPRYKTLRFLSTQQREAVQDELVSLMANLPQYVQRTEAHAAAQTEDHADEQNEQQTPAAKRQLLDCLRGDIVTEEQRAPTSNELEIEAYLCEPVRTQDPLDWWKFHEHKFPKIAVIARRYLCIPATEVPSERSFSAAGNTVTKRRAALDPDKVDELLFIHKNYAVIEGRNHISRMPEATCTGSSDD